MKRKNIFYCLMLVCSLLWGGRAQANLYRITGVSVVAERDSALAAKEAALAEGQVVAFKQLIQKLAPENAVLLPDVSEESVLSYVQGVSIENEKTTATKYIGSIAVEFDPEAIKEFLKTEKVTYLKAQPPSLLVVPIYQTDQGVSLLDAANPLYQALKEKGVFAPFYQAVVPEGTSEEQVLLQQNPQEATALLSKYKKEKVMLLKLIRESDNIWQVSTEFYPLDNMENQRVNKKFRFYSSDLKLAAGQISDLVFQEMENRWRGESSSSLADEKTLYLRVPVNSLEELQSLEKEMKHWKFFEEIKLKGLYLPQILFEGTYKDSVGGIAQKLWNRGWKIELDETGSGATLTRIKDDE